MTRADLFREYARVIEMCEGTIVNPTHCVRFAGADCPDDKVAWGFGAGPELYTFALDILENKPVFAGDILYSGKCAKLQAVSGGKRGVIICDRVDVPVSNLDYLLSELSWNPPISATRKMALYLDDLKVFDMYVTRGQKVGFNPDEGGQGDIEFTFQWKR